MTLVGRIGIKRNPQPHRGDHAISIRIDTSTKAIAKSQISEMDPEIAKSGGKPLTLGAYAKRAFVEYPSLRTTYIQHQILVNKLTALRDVFRLTGPEKGVALGHVAAELDRLLTVLDK
jgi:hypothetical protein